MHAPTISSYYTSTTDPGTDKLVMLFQKYSDKPICIDSAPRISIGNIPQSANLTAGKGDDALRIEIWPLSLRAGEVSESNSRLDKLHEHELAQGYKAFKLMNTALSIPRAVFKIGQINGHYLVYHSFRDDVDFMYKALYNSILAAFVLHLKGSEHQDLIDRLTAAIVDKKSLEYTPEEEAWIAEQTNLVKKQQMLKKAKRDLSRHLITKPNYRTSIDNLSHDINGLSNRIAELESQRQEFIMKQFAIDAGYVTTGTDEFFEYLESVGAKFLLDVQATGGRTYITVWNYLHLTQDSADFLRSDPVNNEDHPLYRRPRVYKILKAAIDGKLRLPIMAGYRIDTAQGQFGVTGTRDTEYTASQHIRNWHVNKFNCFTQHKTMIRDFYHNHNFIGMFEQLLECTTSINVYDSPVIKYIIEDIQELPLDVPVQVRTEQGWINTPLKFFMEQEENNETTQVEPQEPEGSSTDDTTGTD